MALSSAISSMRLLIGTTKLLVALGSRRPRLFLKNVTNLMALIGRLIALILLFLSARLILRGSKLHTLTYMHSLGQN